MSGPLPDNLVPSRVIRNRDDGQPYVNTVWTEDVASLRAKPDQVSDLTSWPEGFAQEAYEWAMLHHPANYGSDLRAAASLIPDREQVPAYLAERARVLNTLTPQSTAIANRPELLTPLTRHRPAVEMRSVDWVPTGLIIQTDTVIGWGHLDDEGTATAHRIANSLRKVVYDGHTVRAWTQQFIGPPDAMIRLRLINGPAGPVYVTDGDGIVRVHIARLLGIKHVLADVISPDGPVQHHVRLDGGVTPARRVRGISAWWRRTRGIDDSYLDTDAAILQFAQAAATLGRAAVSPLRGGDAGYAIAARDGWLIIPQIAEDVERAYQNAYPDFDGGMDAREYRGFTNWVQLATRRNLG